MDGEAILADKWTKFTVGYKMLLTFNTLQSPFITVKLNFKVKVNGLRTPVRGMMSGGCEVDVQGQYPTTNLCPINHRASFLLVKSNTVHLNCELTPTAHRMSWALLQPAVYIWMAFCFLCSLK